MTGLKEGQQVLSVSFEDEEAILKWAAEIAMHVRAIETLVTERKALRIAVTAVETE